MPKIKMRNPRRFFAIIAMVRKRSEMQKITSYFPCCRLDKPSSALNLQQVLKKSKGQSMISSIGLLEIMIPIFERIEADFMLRPVMI